MSQPSYEPQCRHCRLVLHSTWREGAWTMGLCTACGPVHQQHKREVYA